MLSRMRSGKVAFDLGVQEDTNGSGEFAVSEPWARKQEVPGGCRLELCLTGKELRSWELL